MRLIHSTPLDAPPGAPIDAAATSCPVCDSARIVVDAIEEAGTSLLFECSRCDHRWMRAECDRALTVQEPPVLQPGPGPGPGPDPDRWREVASAA